MGTEYYTRKIYLLKGAKTVHDTLEALEGDLEKRRAYIQEKEAEVNVLREVGYSVNS